MKANRFLTIILTIILLLMLCAAVNSEGYIPKGEGTIENPYLIYTLEDLKRIGNDDEWTLDKHYKMMNDIILEKPKEGENNWSPIGFHSAFTGTFDGNGKVISGMVIQKDDSQIIGLFSKISGKNARVEKLGITDVIINIDSKSSNVIIGALTAFVRDSATIKDCYSTGSISGGNITGGLIGMFVNGIIERCYSNANVQDSMSDGDNSTGGLIGYFFNGPTPANPTNGPINPTLTRCYTTGNVYGSGMAGGLVGTCNSGWIKDCYTTGHIRGHVDVGGITGYSFENDDSIIENCYTTGSLTGEEAPRSSRDRLHGIVCGITSSCYLDITNCAILSQHMKSSWLSYISLVGKYYADTDYADTDYMNYIKSNYVLDSINIKTPSDELCEDYNEEGIVLKSKEELTTQATYEELGWDFTGPDAVWEFSGDYKLPKLVGVGGQDELITPEHLQ